MKFAATDVSYRATHDHAALLRAPGAPRPPARMNNFVRSVRNFLVSLQLTVVLLVLSLILVFVATLDQVNLGIWAVQEKYFRSFLVIGKLGDVPLPIFPGGYLIGGLLLANLLAAHFYRFSLTWRKSGIQLTHLGLILLLVGELMSGLWQESYTMRIQEGQTINYSEHERDFEVAVTDTSDAELDTVVAIPESLLAAGRTIQHPSLPFRVVPKLHYPNAALSRRAADAGAPTHPATSGIGPQVAITPLPITYKESERNLPLACVELVGPGGSLGTWLLSPYLETVQKVTVDGKTWTLVMRATRHYKPFALSLKEVRHDVYPGTEIPKNFSSRVQLRTPDGREDREVLIYMNNPLRYAGLTFYQHQMDAGHKTTGLLVVKNPSWVLPYVACALMTGGLLIQFLLHLAGFIQRRRAAATA